MSRDYPALFVMPVTHSGHTLRQHPCGFLRGNCAVLQDSAVPDIPQTCSESLSVVCDFCLYPLLRIHESELNKLTYDTELESIYITGSFGVRAEDEISYGEQKTIFAGSRFTLTEMPKTVDIEKITESGFWFFSGAMELTESITVNKKENTKYVLSFAKLNAPAARLEVNGKKASILMFAPYSADITDYLKDGENEIKTVLLSGNRNLLGPHHKPQGEIYSVGPTTFTDKYGWADDRSKPAWTDNYSFVRFGING